MKKKDNKKLSNKLFLAEGVTKVFGETEYLSFFWLTCCHFILQIALLYLSAGWPQLTNKKILSVPAESAGETGSRKTNIRKQIVSDSNRVVWRLEGCWRGGGGWSQMVRPESAPKNLPRPWVFPHISQAAVDTSPQRPRKPITDANKNMAWDSVRNFCVAPADR